MPISRPNWLELTLHAYELLRRPDLGGLGETGVQYVIVSTRPFRDPTSWIIVDSATPQAEGAELQIQSRVWRSTTDYPDLDLLEQETGLSPDSDAFRQAIIDHLPQQPTIDSAAFMLPRSVLADELTKIIDAATVPLVLQGIHPYDCESYDITIRSLLSGITYCWWGEGPVEWRDFTRIVMRCVDILRANYTVS